MTWILSLTLDYNSCSDGITILSKIGQHEDKNGHDRVYSWNHDPRVSQLGDKNVLVLQVVHLRGNQKEGHTLVITGICNSCLGVYKVKHISFAKKLEKDVQNVHNSSAVQS